HIYDPGVLDTPDLNRQTLYAANDIGKEKALRAAELLRAIGPELSVTAHVERAGAKTDFSYADIVVDCLDTFSARFLIDEATYEAGVPFVHAGVYKYFGQVTSVQQGRTRPLRELFAQSAAAMDAEPAKPMYPPAVTTVAAFEASECVRVLLGEDEKTLFGRLLSIDLDSLEVTVLPFR
ncbi:MAG: HesA/MoeB/ThiF family protein, partial [Spirochaetota bacterium]